MSVESGELLMNWVYVSECFSDTGVGAYDGGVQRAEDLDHSSLGEMRKPTQSANSGNSNSDWLGSGRLHQLSHHRQIQFVPFEGSLLLIG